MLQTTLRLGGRDVEVVVIPPLVSGVDVLTEPVRCEGSPPMALGYCRALGYFLEVGPGAGEDGWEGAMLSAVKGKHGGS